MIKPIQALYARIALGFTRPQKIAITIAAIVYVVSPLDCIPDLILGLGWIDDAFVINLVRKVWMSPTLPPKSGGGSGSSSDLQTRVTAAFTRARKDFAEGFANGREGRS